MLPDLRPGLPDSFVRVVQRALESRYQTPGAMMARYQRFYFDAGWRFAIEPRVTFKPLAIGRRDGNKERGRDILQIKASFVAIPGSLEASDFDAIGSFESSGELIPTISIGADFVAWFRR